MQARANAVAKCLRDKVPLCEAAASCGFFNQAHMSRVFKKGFVSTAAIMNGKRAKYDTCKRRRARSKVDEPYSVILAA
jgi:AraC-like DNA-binding protein